MPDIFLSYSREDKVIAKRFAQAFEREGFSVWWDATLNPGEAYDKVTEKALEEAKAVVVLWSRKSVDSRWVRSEATQANANGTLVPVMVEPCKRPIMFELTHTSDLSHWNGDPNDEEWQSYLAGVRRFVRKDAPGAGPTAPPAWVPDRKSIGPWVIAAMVVALLLSGASWWLLKGRGTGQATSSPGTAAPPATKPDTGITLAVLPFDDYSAAKDQEYFADGMTEELTAALARVPGLKVVGRTSAFQYKGKANDLRKIGEELHARYLLEGSVRKADNRLKITAQLIEAQSGLHLWVDTYERKATDVFAIQEEIATTIATALRVPLNVSNTQLVSNRSVDQEAYEDYLRARALVHQRDFPGAVKLLKTTVERNPDYAPAWALMGYAEGFLGYKAPTASARVSANVRRSYDGPARLAALDAGERSVRRAIALDPEGAAGYFAWAYIQLWRDNWIESEELFKKTLSIDSEQPDALLEYMVLLTRTGRLRDAMATGRRLLELEPFVPTYKVWTVNALQAADRQKEAIPLLQGIPESSREFPASRLQLGWAYADIGQFAQSAEAIRDLARVPPPRSLAALPDLLEQIEYAAQSIGKAPATGGSRDLLDVFSWMYAYTGAPERVTPPLTDESSKFFVGTDIWSSIRTPFRKSPEFRKAVQRAGLVEYWKKFGWADQCRPIGADDFACD